MAFGDWLLSFSITFSSFIQGLSHVTVLYSFLWLNLILLCGYITFCLSVPQLKNGFPFLSAASGEETPCQCRRHRFYPWVRKIPWRRAWQPTSVFLPGESHRGALQALVHRVTKSQTRLKRLSTYIQLKDLWVVSTFLLLQIMLHITFLYSILYEYVFSFLIYLGWNCWVIWWF